MRAPRALKSCVPGILRMLEEFAFAHTTVVPVDQPLFELGDRRRVANRRLGKRIIELLGRRGGATSREIARAAYGRRLDSRVPASVSQHSAVRRALARMIREGLVVKMGHRRHGRKLYWRRTDAEALSSLSLGVFDGG
jgi:hypothetical protein